MAKGIFIEGLTKPKRCSRHCLFADKENYDCVLIADSISLDTFDQQYRRCPLIEAEMIEVETEDDASIRTNRKGMDDETSGSYGQCHGNFVYLLDTRSHGR